MFDNLTSFKSHSQVQDEWITVTGGNDGDQTVKTVFVLQGDQPDKYGHVVLEPMYASVQGNTGQVTSYTVPETHGHV